MTHATITTLDPHTTGTITDRDGNELEIVPFGFYREDATEWERLADAEIEAAGWVRTGPWRENTAPVAPTTLWIASSTLRDETEVREIVLDAMGGYERGSYAPDIQAGKVAEVAREEWENVWTQGDGVFTNETEAREYVADENEGGRRLKVVEITLADVAAALEVAFGDE